MRRIGSLGAAIAFALAVVACGSDSGVDSLTVEGAWSRPTPAGATNGVVYLTITSPVDDEIESVSVPSSVAGSAMMHETVLDGIAPPAMPGMDMGDGSGDMSMVPLDSLPLPAGEAVVFEAGAKHIMLMDLATPLVEGRTFPLTLELRDAGPLTVDVIVSPNPPG